MVVAASSCRCFCLLFDAVILSFASESQYLHLHLHLLLLLLVYAIKDPCICSCSCSCLPLSTNRRIHSLQHRIRKLLRTTRSPNITRQRLTLPITLPNPRLHPLRSRALD